MVGENLGSCQARSILIEFLAVLIFIMQTCAKKVFYSSMFCVVTATYVSHAEVWL